MFKIQKTIYQSLKKITLNPIFIITEKEEESHKYNTDINLTAGLLAWISYI